MAIVRSSVIFFQGIFLISIGLIYDLDQVGRYFILSAAFGLANVPIACGFDRFIQRRYFVKEDTQILIKKSFLAILLLSATLSLIIFFILTHFNFINILELNSLVIFVYISILFRPINYYVLFLNKASTYQNWLDSEIKEKLFYFIIANALLFFIHPDEILFILFAEWIIGYIFLCIRVIKHWNGFPFLSFYLPKEFINYFFISILTKFLQQLLSRALIFLPANFSNLEIPAIIGYVQKVYSAAQTVLIYIITRNFNLLSISNSIRKDIIINKKIIYLSFLILIIIIPIILSLIDQVQFILLAYIFLISFYFEVERNLDNNSIVFNQLNFERVFIFIPSLLFIFLIIFLTHFIVDKIDIYFYAVILLIINLLNFLTTKFILRKTIL